MVKRKGDPVFSGREMADFIAGALNKQARSPNMYGYKPHEKQERFHKSVSRGRLYIGGNRSGKSVGGVIEDLWWATGRHPFLETPEPPVYIRVVGVDFINGIEGILFPIFKRWVVPSDLKGGTWNSAWSNRERTLTFENGSEIDFKSSDQDLDKHAGTARHMIHFDEEPPRAIFNENLLRLVDYGGSFVITMTPVEGMTWVYHDLYEPFQLNTLNPDQDLDVIQVSMDDNPYLSEKEKREILSYLSETEVEKRRFGRFVPKGGLVYPEFEEAIHATLHGWRPPSDWLIYQSIDHGFNNPTAILYHAVSPDGMSVVTFKELYGREKIVSQWAKECLEFEREWHIEPFLRTGDPAMKQRQAQSGLSIAELYGQEGLYLALDTVPRSVDAGVNKITQYLRVNSLTGKPHWQISDCPNLVRELNKLHWAYFTSPKLTDANNLREVIHKKDDHAPDSARYFFTFLPDLSAMTPTPTSATDYLLEGIKPGTIWDILNRAQPPVDNFGPTSTEWMVTSGFGVTDDYWEDDY